jgi:hypothetical protein
MKQLQSFENERHDNLRCRDQGRGIAAFHSHSAHYAEHFVRDYTFRDDLMTLMADGLPI